jgi:chromosome segregation ATPase
MLKNTVRNLEQKMKEKANVSNQLTQLDEDLKESKNRAHDLVQKLEARDIEVEALRNQFMMFQSDTQTQINHAVNSEKQRFSEIETGLIQRISSLERQLLEKTKKVEEQEHDNDDMMDIIEKLEEKLARLQSGQSLDTNDDSNTA